MDSRSIMGLCLLAVVLPAVVLSAPVKVKKRSTSYLSNPIETVNVLEELIGLLKENSPYEDLRKRNLGAGYGSRFSAANNYGTKMLALHHASDVNSPGRKRREATSEQ